jgi:hypothetical protein
MEGVPFVARMFKSFNFGGTRLLDEKQSRLRMELRQQASVEQDSKKLL